MLDELGLQRTGRLIEAYTRYREDLDKGPPWGTLMPYEWWALPNPLSGIWMIYAGMLCDYATDLSNIINDLTGYVARLRAWAKVVAPMSSDERIEVAHEFVGMLGIAALGSPYAIKSRFAVAAANLCHQARRATNAKNWEDEFPTKRLYLNDVDQFGDGWRAYRPFKRRVEPIAGKIFKAKTCDFRNSYNHGFSPRVLLGITNSVSRVVDSVTGNVGYEIGGAPPLDLNNIADLLTVECSHCYRAFEAFQRLVGEQVDAISAFEAEHAKGQLG